MHIYKGILRDHLKITSGTNQRHQKNSAKEQLDDMLNQVIEFQLKEAMQMKIYVRLMLFPPGFLEEDLKAQLREVEKQEQELLSDIFKRGMENGEIKQGDPHELATLMICVMDGLFWQMQRYEEATFKQHFQVIWDQFWRGIKN
nr:hypothetical protein [Evansella tamaricis]